jgi:hypothetical protein
MYFQRLGIVVSAIRREYITVAVTCQKNDIKRSVTVDGVPNDVLSAPACPQFLTKYRISPHTIDLDR